MTEVEHVSIETAAIRGAAERTEKYLAQCALISAALAAAVGLLVLLGWYARVPLLVSAGPQFVAMQFNTAVAFLLAGAALLVLRSGDHRVAQACAFGVFAIGSLTLFEHVSGQSMGIDEVLWRLGVSRSAMGELANVRQSAPGRMAPNTSLCLALLGTALLLLAAGQVTQRRLAAAAAAALVASSLGAVAFSGYVIGVPTAYGWGNMTRMAVHTSVVVSVCGAGILVHAVLVGMERGLPTRRWGPLLASAAVAMATLMMWQALVDHDRRFNARVNERQAQVVAGELTRRLADHGRVVERLAVRWAHGGAANRQSWEYAATQLIRDYPALASISYLDSASLVRWTAPVGEKLPLNLGARFGAEERRAEVLRRAVERRTVEASAPVLLSSTNMGTFLAAPIVRETSVVGFVVGEVEVATLLSEMFDGELAQGYGIALRDGPTALYTRRRPHEADPTAWRAEAPVRAFGREWTLGVVPTVEQIRITRSNVPIAFLVVGLSCAVFLGWTVRLAQRSREQTLRVARVAEQLSAENVARRAAELELEAQAEELMAQSEELEQQNAMLQDIAAELEEQRDALERAQEFKAALVRSSTGGIAAYDAGGLVNAWNPAMEALTGMPRTDAIGHAFHGTLTFLTREEEARLMAEGLAGRASRLDDLRARAAERNDVSWLDVIATPMLGTDGRVIGVLVVARDVTERKRAADSILASKYEAEQASRAKSDFMARMSHELRTPLNSVIGFSNILLRNKDSQLGASDLTYLARIRANGRHLLSLINQILDLSKVEAGHETVVLVPTAIGPLVTDTVAELDVRASEAQLVLQTCVPDGLDDVVTDPEKLKQVLINLIGNAIKFTPPSGRVTVSVIPAAVVGMPMRIEVEDTGIGIPEDRLLAIFEAFEQADEETSRVYGGTGLGLAISQKLCALMGHDLIVHSVQGAGSTFAVLLYPGETCRAA